MDARVKSGLVELIEAQEREGLKVVLIVASKAGKLTGFVTDIADERTLGALLERCTKRVRSGEFRRNRSVVAPR